VAFISKALNPTERNYEIHNKEMLAVIQCLDNWRHYLEGAKLEFEIWTDHKNLQYFMTSQKLNHRQARWALYLSRFNLTLKHISGKSMGKVDSLSRRPDWQVVIEKNNKDRVLVKKEWLRRTEEVVVEEGDLRSRIKEAQEKDEKVVKVVKEMKSWHRQLGHTGAESICNMISGKLVDGLYVPEGPLRVEVIKLHHSTAVGKHRGRWKTTEVIGRNYWWPGMTKEVRKYVEGCDTCQRYKNWAETPAGKLIPNPIPEKAWTHIPVDFITKLSVTGHK